MDRQSALLRSAFWFGYHQMWISYWSFAAEWTYSCKAYVWLLRIIRNSKEIYLSLFFAGDWTYSCKTYVRLLRITRNSNKIYLMSNLDKLDAFNHSLWLSASSEVSKLGCNISVNSMNFTIIGPVLNCFALTWIWLAKFIGTTSRYTMIHCPNLLLITLRDSKEIYSLSDSTAWNINRSWLNQQTLSKSTAQNWKEF